MQEKTFCTRLLPKSSLDPDAGEGKREKPKQRDDGVMLSRPFLATATTQTPFAKKICGTDLECVGYLKPDSLRT